MNSVMNMQNETQSLPTSTARRLKASSKLMGVAAVTALSAMAAQAVPTTLYTSNGFESFNEADLVGGGQVDGWQSFGAGSGGSSTATVSSLIPVAGGSKAVELTRVGSDGAGSTGFYKDLTGSSQDRYVFVEFDMQVNTNPSETDLGPAFSMELYTTGATRVAGFGVDAADASFLQYTSNAGGASFTNVGLSLDVYQSWFVVVDLVGEVYNVFVDDNFVATAAFLEDIDYGAGDRLTDASLVVAPSDGAFLNVTGTSYIDNYAITTDTVVPEPASLAILGIAAAAFVSRRRRQG